MPTSLVSELDAGAQIDRRSDDIDHDVACVPILPGAISLIPTC